MLQHGKKININCKQILSKIIKSISTYPKRIANMPTFYNQASWQVKADVLANFLAASVEEDLETVPGIGAWNK